MLSSPAMKPRIPRHVGIIPDGNRRWARERGRPNDEGYQAGILPGLRLAAACRNAGIEQVSVYGFTVENTRRPPAQVTAFRRACVELAGLLVQAGAALRVVGDAAKPAFPAPLRPFLRRRGRGLKVNLLVNYGWAWDLAGAREGSIRTHDIPAVELVIRWGGARRLSGFLPVQSAYADFFIVDALWPDFDEGHLRGALEWYETQDRTLGG